MEPAVHGSELVGGDREGHEANAHRAALLPRAYEEAVEILEADEVDQDGV